MYGSLDISTSGMIAQRVRMTAISANIANARTMLDAQGNVNPYKRAVVHFSPGNPASASADGQALGVHVAFIEKLEDAVRKQWVGPNNPLDIDKDGYIEVPDISTVTEQMNAMEASRAYEANIAAAETTKSMMAQVLRLIA